MVKHRTIRSNKIEQLAKKTQKPNQIGIILGDDSAVPQIRLIISTKFLRVLKKWFSCWNYRSFISFIEISCCKWENILKKIIEIKIVNID